MNNEDAKQNIAVHFPQSFAVHFLPIKPFEAHWHRDPVATHMSAFLYQYWYWADRSLALSKFDLAFVFWLMLRRSFRKRQQRSRLLLRGQSLSARRGTPRVVLPSEPLFGLFKSFRRAWEACSAHCPAWNWTVTIDHETASRANGWREGWTSMAPDRTKLAMSSDVGRCVHACGCALGCWCAGVKLITAPFRCSATCPWTFIMATVSDTKARFHRKDKQEWLWWSGYTMCSKWFCFMLEMTWHLLSVLRPTQRASPAVRRLPTRGRTSSWGLSLANRPIICQKLQFLVTNIIPSIWIQDSRFKAQKKLLQSNLFGFKIQGSEKNIQSHLRGFKIQDSRRRTNFFNPTFLDTRFKIQGSEKLLEPHLFGFKIQGSEKTSSIPPVWIEDSRFNARKKLLQSYLNPTPLDARSLFGILILESYPLEFKKSFWDLESWILNPTPLDSRSPFGILNLESWFRCT